MQYAQKSSKKACQGRGQHALPLREWPHTPFSSAGLSSPCVFVYCSHNTDPEGRDPHHIMVAYIPLTLPLGVTIKLGW